MDLDAAIQRYLADPAVARWLFSTEEINTVSAEALDSCFVYAIGFGQRISGKAQAMSVEDMLIVTGTAGSFVLGFLWGLSQPHIFSRTPLMLDRQPIARRFAVDMSRTDALEFMEFVSFDDGKTIVVFRKFLHTQDESLPVVVCGRLHAASQVQETLGSVLMRADCMETPLCPACALPGRNCLCNFEDHAPSTVVRRSTFNWNQFSSRFMNKARVSTFKLRMTASLPGVGEMCIMDDEIPAINVLQKGATDYLTLLRRKAVHGLGINVVMPRTDIQILTSSTESDFLDLHNSYVSRKRVRDDQEDPTNVLQEIDSIELPDALLDLTTTQQVNVDTSLKPTSLAVQEADYFGLISEPFHALNSGNTDKSTEPPSHDSVVATKEEMKSPDMESNAFAAESPESLMDSLLDPNLAVTSPSMTDVGTELAERQNDIFGDIQLILSPDGAANQSDGQTGFLPVGTSGDALTKARSPPVVHWTSSISSEDSASSPVQRKPATTKRAKRARAPASRGHLSAQASSDSTGDDEKKHGCKMCTSRFKMRGDLLRHVKTVHEGKKMYTCKTCGKSFGHSGHLNRHISSVHLQQRRFKCQYCGFQFFQASHLHSHIGHIHSVKKPHKCKFCGVRVNSETALKNHMLKAKCSEAIADEALACPFHGCSSKFTSQEDLDVHNALVHQAIARVLTPGSQFQALPS